MKSFYLYLVFCISSIALTAQTPNFSWAKQLDGDSFTYNVSFDIAADPFGNNYTVGYFQGTMDADPDTGTHYLTSNGSEDMFLCKLNKAGKLVWAHSFGGIEVDALLSVTVDLSGNVFVAGGFSDTVDFDPDTSVFELVSSGYVDICVVKFSAAGKLVWAKRMGGVYSDAAYGIALDRNGNVLTTGFFEDVGDFDPGTNDLYLSAQGLDDVFVSKLNSSGDLVWAKQFEGRDFSNSSIGFSIVADASGNVYTTGSFEDTMDCNPAGSGFFLVSNGEADIFVTKLNSSGAFQWAKQMGGQGYDEARCIGLDASSNVYTTGSFEDVVDFNPGASTLNITSNGGTDIFISKLDVSGNHVWTRRAGGSDDDNGISLQLDASNAVLSTGSFGAAVDFDPSGNTNNVNAVGYSDAYVWKLSSSGQFNWVQRMGGADAFMAPTAIALTPSGSIYSTGSFDGETDMDPGTDSFKISAYNKFNIYVHKMQICVSTSGSITVSECNSYTANGQTYTASGTYTQTLKNGDGCDSVLTIKLTLKKTANSITTSACKQYVLNGQTYTASGTYTQKLTNAAGCDSILTLNLTIKNTSKTLTVSACNSYTLNSQTYNATGTYTQTLTNAAGCDSIITLNLTIGSNNTASTITETTCDTFWANGQLYTNTGTYTQTLVNSVGCDSVITLKLTINKSTIKTLVITACKFYYLNNQVYASSGSYRQHLTNKAGCDSTIKLDLTVNNVVSTVQQTGATLTADATTGTYQWVDCGNGKTPISGATQRAYTATKNGSYAVILTQNSCTDTSVCFQVTGLGVESDFPANGFKVFPNPTTDVVTVLLSQDLLHGSLKVMGVTGKTILYQEDISGLMLKFDLANESPGIYVLEIRQDNMVYRTQLLRR